MLEDGIALYAQISPRRRLAGAAAASLLCAGLLMTIPGCASPYGEPTRPFPQTAEQAYVADVQIFREGPELTLVSATATSYRNVGLWINQRFVQHVEELPAGGRVTLNLFDFRDASGERFRGGGFFAAKEPDPVVIAQFELEDGSLVGLVPLPVRSLE